VCLSHTVNEQGLPTVKLRSSRIEGALHKPNRYPSGKLDRAGKLCKPKSLG